MTYYVAKVKVVTEDGNGKQKKNTETIFYPEQGILHS